MIAADTKSEILQRVDEIRQPCPEMRLGQVLATIGLLGEDTTGRSLWDLEDQQLAAAVERFADDLKRRQA
ncbi:MAG TPA: hypothetical protein VML55_13990 [Planctomycetaceae bacterium]|nr:hypothetical protein [Planctomycetaceae bacterium]